MRRILSFSVISCLALSLVVSSPAQAAPKGTKWVDKSRAKNIGSTVCAKVGKQTKNTYVEVWTAGKWVNKKQSQFISYNSLASNAAAAAKKAKGTKKKTLTKQSASYSKLSKTYTPKCKKVNALKVNTKSKAGLAKVSGSSSSLSLQSQADSSNSKQSQAKAKKYSSLMAVSADGKLTEGITNFAALLESYGNCSGCGPTVSGILAAPNDDIYIIFSQAININDISNPYGYNGMDQDRCLVAVAHKGAETLDCLDWELQWLNSWTQGTTGNTLIQFDDAGNAYYAGQYNRNGTYYSGIRRATPAGKIKDVVRGPNQENMGSGVGLNISSFVVMPQGDMIVVGSTNRGNSWDNWIRLYPSVGDYVILNNGSWGNGFMRLFPDGNVYFSTWGGGGNQLLVFDSNTLVVRPEAFLGQSNSANLYSDVCGQNYWECSNIVSNYGSFIAELDKETETDSDNSLYALNTNSGYDNAKILELFPSPKLVSAGMNQAKIIEGAGNVLVSAGSQKTQINLNQNSYEYVVNIIDPVTGEVTPVTGASGIDVYTLAYNGSNNTVILSGQRTSGEIVTGTINLDSATLSVTTSNFGRVDDIELFQG
jgi:hypothetical protein